MQNLSEKLTGRTLMVNQSAMVRLTERNLSAGWKICTGHTCFLRGTSGVSNLEMPKE